MLNFVKKQFKKETFHFFGILIIILIFSYFLGDYLLEATNGGVSNEEKFFTLMVFGFFSLCSVGIIIGYFTFIKILNYYKIINKKYIKQIATIIYMILLTVILLFSFIILTSIYPEFTISQIKEQKSGLMLNFKGYNKIKTYYINSTSIDGNGNIYSIGQIIECVKGNLYYIENFFDKELIDNKETGIYCEDGVLCKKKIYKFDKNGKKIKKIKIYNHSTKEEIIINFEEKEKYFKKLCD